jgi:threonine/homoserine/homoserine lactone efflux protein
VTPVGAALAGVLAGLGIAMPLGAIGAYLVTLTARAGWRVGAAAALGVATADGLYATVAVVGGQVVADVVAPVAGPLRVAAALVLAGVAVSITVSAVRSARRGGSDVDAGQRLAAAPTARRAYAGLLALTIANPATVVYFVALVVGNRSADAGSGLVALAFVVGAFLASASWQLLLVGGGHALGVLASSARGRLVVSLVASLLVLALAAHTAFA